MKAYPIGRLVGLFSMLIAATVEAATITGTATSPVGNPIAGATIKASSGDTTTTASGPPPSGGTYSLTVPNGWSGYIVASHKPGPAYLVNVPAYRAITNASGTITGQDFTLQTGPGYSPETLSGTVTVSGGGGLSNVLVYASSGTGGGDITAVNGSYAFGIQPSGGPPKWTGAVTSLLSGYTFTPAQSNYSSASVPITGCNFVGSPSGGGGGSTSVLSLAKTANAQSVTGGQVVAFTLTLTNSGTAAASNTVVTDAISPWLTCDPGSIGGGGSYSSATRTVYWSLGTFTAGSNRVMTFNATVTSPVPTAVTISNLAQVVADGITNNSPTWEFFRAKRRFGGGGGSLGSYADRVTLGIAYERLPCDIQTNDFTNSAGINFSDADMKVLNAQSNNIQKFGIIAFNGNGTWPPATNLGPVVARYVERYDGDGVNDMPGLTIPIQQWEIFNEYNTNWSGYAGCTEAMYAQYLSNAYVWAHAACSNIQVIASAVPTARGNRSGWYLNNFLTNTWVTNYFDAMNYHAYQDYYPFVSGSTSVCDYLQIRDFKNFLAGYGLAGRELWATETDFSGTYMDEGQTATQTNNACYLARSYPFALACGVDHIFYTELEYVPMMPTPLKWAVLNDSNSNRRAVFYVLQKLIQKLEGFQSASLTDFSGGSLGAQFVFSNQVRWVVWNYSNLTAQVQVPAGTANKALVTAAIPASFNNSTASWTVTTNTASGGYFPISASSNAVYVEPFTDGNVDILTIDKMADDQTVTNNQTVTFSLQLTLQPGCITTNTVVQDVVSADLTCLTNTISTGGVFNEGTRTITWNIGTFHEADNRCLAFAAKVSGTVTVDTLITNVAVVSYNFDTNSSLPLLLQVVSSGGGGSSVAASNRIVFCRQQSADDWDIWLMDRDGKNAVAILDDSYASRMPRFSPDGTKICFVRMFSGSSNDVFVMNADGSGVTNLTIGSSVAGKAMSPRFSWDSTKICFDVTGTPGNSDLYLMNADGSGKTPVLTTSTDDGTPAFSPDGNWLVFQRLTSMSPEPHGPIAKVRISDGYVTNLTSGEELDEMPVFSPDGQYVIYKHDDPPEIYRCPSDHNPADSNALVNLTQAPTYIDDSPAYSPDGTAIAYMSSTGGQNHMEIWLMNADGSGKTQLTSNAQNDFDPSFSPGTAGGSGPVPSLVLTKSANAQSVTGGQEVVFTLSLTNSGSATASNTVVRDTLSTWLTYVSASGGGTYDSGTRDVTWDLGAFSAGSNKTLTLSITVSNGLAPGAFVTNTARASCTQTGTNQANAVTLRGALPAVAWSKIVFCRYTTTTNSHLRLMDWNGANEVALTESAYMDTLPHFSPDGTRVVFGRVFSMQQMLMDIMRINADGSGETNLTTSISAGCNSPRFSWNGAKICFDVTTTPGNGDLYLMNADGSGITPVLTNAYDDSSPCFSPDGQWLVFHRKTQEEPPKSLIAKVRIADTNTVLLTDGSDVDETPMWSPDGATIIFKRGFTTTDLYAMSYDHNPANNGDLVNLTQKGLPIGTGIYTWENDAIVYMTTTGGVSPTASEVYRMDPNGGNVTRITSNAVQDWDPAPSPVGLWLTASAGASGAISPSGSVRVLYNTSTSFTASASAYFHVSSILTNGQTAAGAGGSQTNFVWSGIVASGTVHALFEENRTVNGTPEWWLAYYYPATQDFAAADVSDTDNDSFPAWKERVAGTIPTDPNSVFQVTNLTASVPGLVIEWLSATSRTYSVQRTGTLGTGCNWTNVAGAASIPGDGYRKAWTNSMAEGTGFFRVQVHFSP